MSDQLVVRGGAGGVAAQLDQLDTAAGTLHRSAGLLAAALDELHLGRSSLDVLGTSPIHLGAAARLEADLLGVAGDLAGSEAVSRGIGTAAVDAVSAYRGAESANRTLWQATQVVAATAVLTPLALPAVVALQGGLLAALAQSDTVGRWVDGAGAPAPGDAARQPLPKPAGAGSSSTARPGYPAPAEGLTGSAATDATDQEVSRKALAGRRAAEATVGLVGAVVAGPLTVLGAGGGGLAAAQWVARRMRDLRVTGATGVTVRQVPLPPDEAESAQARGYADAFRRVEQTGDGTGGAPGRIRVEATTTPSGGTRYTAYIPGTQTWRTRSSTNPFDTATDVEAAAQEATALSKATEVALRRAGATTQDDVMLVGHSEGGLVAAQLAADPSFQQEFHPVGLLVAGAPIGAFDLPDDLEVVALEHVDDPVGLLDGSSNPDTTRLTTVLAATPAGENPHALTGYVQTAEQADASDDRSLVHARRQLEPFLSGGPTTVTEFQVERSR